MRKRQCAQYNGFAEQKYRIVVFSVGMQPITLDGVAVKDAYRYIGHSSGIRALVGWKKYLITGSDDKSIMVIANQLNYVQIWDVNKGSCFNTLRGHTERILDLCMWNSYLVSASADTTLKVGFYTVVSETYRSGILFLENVSELFEI